MITKSAFLVSIFLCACTGASTTDDAGSGSRADSSSDSARSQIGGSYAGPSTLERAAADARTNGGHVVVARFDTVEGAARLETLSYGPPPDSYRGERSWSVARYTIVDPLGEQLSGEVRVDGLLRGERIFAPDGSVVRDENNVSFVRDHHLHPAGGTYVLFLVPSQTSGIWLLEWRTSLDGTTVSGDGTALGSDGSRRGDVPLDALRRR